ncbi:FAD:protein FMN transferase [Polaribacter sp. MSW13]|uniref:FAD:protein FMN transferase n=1 Tax=Polaribacter marinus TaxID=2916838 RepID=A0A9X1VMD9_9FLAO|nr:FAD:protein FMN transferase [Polaribacter marinus]MCI2228801.1 FAD:protein FMN transferase [Polaribacter marinus]
MKLKNLSLFFTLLIVFGSCSKKETVLKGYVFGTSYKIAYMDSENHQKALDSLFYLVNKSLSTYIPTSDISRINKGDTTVVVDALFAEVFLKSKEIYKNTNGFFDPTVGGLVNAYGFGPKKEKKNLSAKEVKELMQFVGFDKVSLINGKIKKAQPEMYLDFNSIAKGFGIDVVARFLESKNINNYLIEIGGEIRAKGVKANQQPWIIQLVNPLKADTGNGFRKLNLSNKSMATSGNYRKYRVDDKGNKYVHILNPKTGFATESNLLSASVIAKKDCANVDAYATAFMAMGLEQTKAFLKKNKDLEVILLYSLKDGTLQEYTTYTSN